MNRFVLVLLGLYIVVVAGHMIWTGRIPKSTWEVRARAHDPNFKPMLELK